MGDSFLTAREGNIEIVNPRKQFPMLPSRAVNNYYDMLYWMLIKYLSTLRLFSQQSGSSEYLSLYFVLRKTNAHTTLAKIYGEPYAHKFCAVDNCWNITRRQA